MTNHKTKAETASGRNSASGRHRGEGYGSDGAEIITPRLLSVEAATRYSGIGRTRLYEEIAAGRIVARKHGTRTLIDRASLDEWIDALPAAQFAA